MLQISVHVGGSERLETSGSSITSLRCTEVDCRTAHRTVTHDSRRDLRPRKKASLVANGLAAHALRLSLSLSHQQEHRHLDRRGNYYEPSLVRGLARAARERLFIMIWDSSLWSRARPLEITTNGTSSAHVTLINSIVLLPVLVSQRTRIPSTPHYSPIMIGFFFKTWCGILTSKDQMHWSCEGIPILRCS